MARRMLKTKKIPKEFWDEVVDCVVYLSEHISGGGFSMISREFRLTTDMC